MPRKSKMLKIDPTENPKKVVMLYIRVSTDRQAEEGYSIDIQKERLAAYVKSMFGSSKDVETLYFIDDGYSGGSLNRPEMQKMITLIESGVGSHVIVYKLDRLSRSQKDTLYLIEDVFLAHNIAFVSMQESFNTATPFGRAVVGILSVFAQLERENIFERTRSGMQKRVESGLWMGGGNCPFGYDYDKEKGILVPNKDADTVRMVYTLYLQGHSLQKIANLLNLKYERLAYQILTRKSNAGYIVYNGKEYLGKHEPIISLETYEAAMAALADRSERHYTTETTHLLTGLVVCGVCGAKMRYIKWGKKQEYRFMCYSRQKGKPYLVRDPNCDNEYADAKTIEDVVIADIFDFTKQNMEIENPKETIEVGNVLQQQYNDLNKKLKRLYDLYTDDEDETLIEMIQDVKKEMSKLKQKQEEEKERNFWSKNIERTKKELKALSDIWEFMTITEKRNAIRSLIDKIIVTHDRIEIKYKF